MLLIHGVTDMLIRASRSLLLCLLLLVFLVVAGGIHMRRHEKIVISIVLILAIFTVPVMTDYRYWHNEHELSVIGALNKAVGALGHGWWGSLAKGAEFIFFRMPGVESLWAMLSRGAEPLGMQSLDVMAAKNGVAGYLSNHVHPIAIEHNTLLAPGFVGWFYLVAGIPAVLFGSVVAATICVLGWRYLDHNYLVCGPVAQTFLLWVLFVALTEGTLDSMVYMVLAGVVVITSIEFSLRNFIKRCAVSSCATSTQISR